MKTFLALLIFLMTAGSLSAQESFVVYFESNKHDLTQKERLRLDDWIKQNTTSKIVAINGYTDEDGTTKYNDTLAQKRVAFIFTTVKDKVKTREDFRTRSFGESHKQSKVKAENRKVTIHYIEAKDLARENEILGIKPVTEIKRIELPLDASLGLRVQHAKVGDKLKLDNVNFYENTFAVLPESRPKMFELLEIMKNNPKLKIQIQGHICCMPNDRADLSTKRAKAIRLFLEANGIDKSRATFKGFGSTQPIYSLPEKNEEERAANRRVEIEIVEN
ncbi:OmpA family protein [Flavobacterium cerinum]|uniref:OmpA family protein n=1 Tax=Flavobacterium cerinum TaxID=2502784 RepID=A0ABY5IUX2_9FLAO|nr:OmpA family protein [Flavobacterium cerinum]UUC45261.1 OmpA family protein [Flavobacterium cerinum]